MKSYLQQLEKNYALAIDRALLLKSLDDVFFSHSFLILYQ